MGDEKYTSVTDRFEKLSKLKNILMHDITNPLSTPMNCTSIVGYKDGVLDVIENGATAIYREVKRFKEIEMKYDIKTYREDRAQRTLDIHESQLKKTSEVIKSHGLTLRKYLADNKHKVDRNNVVDLIDASLLRIIDVSEMTSAGNLDALTKKMVFADSVNVAKDVIGFYCNKPEIKDAGIGLNLEYDRCACIEMNRAVLSEILNTLLANAYEHALPETNINLGIRKKEEGLEIITKNFYDESHKRPSFGLGKGIGTIFIKTVVKNEMGGEYIIGEDIKMPKYEKMEIFETKEGVSQQINGAKIYSSKVIIPKAAKRNKH